jgi:hypothetical protein
MTSRRGRKERYPSTSSMMDANVRTEISPVGKRTPVRGSFRANRVNADFNASGSDSMRGTTKEPVQYFE